MQQPDTIACASYLQVGTRSVYRQDKAVGCMIQGVPSSENLTCMQWALAVWVYAGPWEWVLRCGPGSAVVRIQPFIVQWCHAYHRGERASEDELGWTGRGAQLSGTDMLDAKP